MAGSNGLALPLSFLLFLLLVAIVESENTTVVSHLPGYRGPLPFSLQTGYVEVDETDGVRLFYYFVQSERNPASDPILLWLSGGPGCSGFSSLVYEIGPLSFRSHSHVDGLPELVYRPDSWTKVANIIFPDSPVGAGFSYSTTEEGNKISDTRTVDQIAIFLTKWYEQHPEFLLNPLYIAGESYSGLIVPPLTFKIARGIEMGDGPLLNLKCLKGIKMYHILEPQCSEYDEKSGGGRMLLDYGSAELPLSDISSECRETGYIMSRVWANDKSVREALGVHEGTVPLWLRCSNSTPRVSDISSSVEYHRSVTGRGYRSLIYSSDHDMTWPFIGTQAWIQSLGFPAVDEWRPWYVAGQVAGFATVYSNNLTFATVKGAGHTAPEYMPKECLAMVSRWLSDRRL